MAPRDHGVKLLENCLVKKYLQIYCIKMYWRVLFLQLSNDPFLLQEIGSCYIEVTKLERTRNPLAIMHKNQFEHGFSLFFENRFMYFVCL
jgi:hypothetical protein